MVGSNICYISPSGATARKSTILSRNLVPKQRFTSESFLKVWVEGTTCKGFKSRSTSVFPASIGQGSSIYSAARLYSIKNKWCHPMFANAPSCNAINLNIVYLFSTSDVFYSALPIYFIQLSLCILFIPSHVLSTIASTAFILPNFNDLLKINPFSLHKSSPVNIFHQVLAYSTYLESDDRSCCCFRFIIVVIIMQA